MDEKIYLYISFLPASPSLKLQWSKAGRLTRLWQEITEFSGETAKEEYPGWGGMNQMSPYRKKRI